MTTNLLPVPAFFKAENARKFNFDPNQQEVYEVAETFRRTHAVKPAGADKDKTALLLIDVQRDFCFPEGSLYVAGRSGTGAMDDNERLARFIYGNLPQITSITTTLDTHFALQVFFSSFWETSDGQALPMHSLVRLNARGVLENVGLDGSVLAENVRPRPAVAAELANGNFGWLMEQMKFYCKSLQDGGKYPLYLWPLHCLLGSTGHALAGVIHEARLFHSFARSAQSTSEVKGGNPFSERYSVFKEEVLGTHDGRIANGQRNTLLLKTLLENDRVIIAGQAASHCVKSSIDDILDEITTQDPKLARKIYIMEDCMSAVTVPDGKGGFVADFTPQAEDALKRFRDAGMHVVRSVSDMDSWPS